MLRRKNEARPSASDDCDMSLASTNLAEAVARHRSGDLGAAEDLYRQLIDDSTDAGNLRVDALHLLGVLYHQRGNYAGAVALIEQALALRPDDADMHANVGESHRMLGDREEAVWHFEQALSAHPDCAAALHNLGLVALAEQRPEHAIPRLRKAVALKPNAVQFTINLGRALFAAGKFDEAVDVFQDIVSLHADHVPALTLLAMSLERAGHRNEALATYSRVIAADPSNVDCLHRIAVVLHRGCDPEAAVSYYRRALRVAPDRGDIRNNLAAALTDCGQPERAIDHYKAAIAANPKAVSAYANLGRALHLSGQLDAANQYLQRALEFAPNHAEALNSLGNVYVDQGHVDEAIQYYERALVAAPGHHAAYVSLLVQTGNICDWRRQSALLAQLPDHLSRLQETGESPEFLRPLGFALPYICRDNELIGHLLTIVGRSIARGARPVTRPHHRRQTDPDKRLHIGYVSPDFGDHPISHVTVPIYAAHDRDQVAVSCFALLDRQAAAGDYLARIRAGADRFIDLSGLSHRDAAQHIANSEVDILIDLGGYMRHARPEIFAMKPAPIQVYWQGHTGTLGAPYIDYVIGDEHMMPASEDDRLAEAVVRMPETFSSADRPPIATDPPSRASQGLPEQGIVFCAFNNPLKIDPTVFKAWMRILGAVPDAVLWLSGGTNPLAEANLKVAAKTAGIAPERLVFAARIADKSVHLARHALADIFLDTFNFNASTTALDALWAGLPLVAKRGTNAYSRITTGYLHAIDMAELVCDSVHAYRSCAVALATNCERLAKTKRRLQANRETSPLFDNHRFVRHLEWAYRHMWHNHARQQTPASFEVPSLDGPS